jgi:endoglucanase
MGNATPPMMRVVNGRKSSDHSGDTWGFWCMKTRPLAEVQPNPRNRVPYRLDEPHFSIAAVSVPAGGNGVVFQASYVGHNYASELRFSNAQPQARWLDTTGNTLLLSSPTVLAAGQPAVVSMTSVAGAQRLRVNAAVAGSGATSFSPDVFEQMLIGFGYQEYYPRDPFGGNVYGVITGKGAPTVQELAVLERYLASRAGLTL